MSASTSENLLPLPVLAQALFHQCSCGAIHQVKIILHNVWPLGAVRRHTVPSPSPTTTAASFPVRVNSTRCHAVSDPLPYFLSNPSELQYYLYRSLYLLIDATGDASSTSAPTSRYKVHYNDTTTMSLLLGKRRARFTLTIVGFPMGTKLLTITASHHRQTLLRLRSPRLQQWPRGFVR